MINKPSSIYTTGALVHPVEMKDYNGSHVWRWVVSSFEDDSYLDGKICDPVESAETCENLLKTDDDDDDDKTITV